MSYGKLIIMWFPMQSNRNGRPEVETVGECDGVTLRPMHVTL